MRPCSELRFLILSTIININTRRSPQTTPRAQSRASASLSFASSSSSRTRRSSWRGRRKWRRCTRSAFHLLIVSRYPHPLRQENRWGRVKFWWDLWRRWIRRRGRRKWRRSIRSEYLNQTIKTSSGSDKTVKKIMIFSTCSMFSYSIRHWRWIKSNNTHEDKIKQWNSTKKWAFEIEIGANSDISSLFITLLSSRYATLKNGLKF